MYKRFIKCIVLILMLSQLVGCAGGAKLETEQLSKPENELATEEGTQEEEESELEVETKTEEMKEYEMLPAPEWTANATMYEVNIRQYTEEGTFRAFQEHLPRLQKMGVKILWFMPIYPISAKKRLGTLGSYYSIADYLEVNPEFGTKEDFKELVEKCHEMGFQVMLDWVANHTGWDHPWIEEHPDWYTQNANGEIIYPETWQDVADLNYNNEDMQNEMKNAMLYWVKEFDVDGFRCDYAGGVPVEFWEDVKKSLDEIKPVFMLAEDDRNMELLNNAFHANYGWSLYGDLNSIAGGSNKSYNLKNYFRYKLNSYPEGTYPLHFIDNHDENSWNGTVDERMGDAQQAMLALIFTVPGMPLLYSGQEVNLNHRLEFFEKDQIIWEDFVNEELITKLVHFRLEHPALWSGEAGGVFEFLEVSDSKVMAYRRLKDKDQVIVVLNLSSKDITVQLTMDQDFEGQDFITSNTIMLHEGDNDLSLKPWDYIVLSESK